jgi:hypothetical protein
MGFKKILISELLVLQIDLFGDYRVAIKKAGQPVKIIGAVSGKKGSGAITA